MIEKICKQLQAFKNIEGDFPTSNLNITLEPLVLLTLLKAQTDIFPAIYWQDKELQQSIAKTEVKPDTSAIAQGGLGY